VAGAAVPAAAGVAAGGSVTLAVLGAWQWLEIAVRMSPISWDLEHYWVSCECFCEKMRKNVALEVLAVSEAVGVAAGGSVTLAVLGAWQWLKIAVRMSPISWDLEHYWASCECFCKKKKCVNFGNFGGFGVFGSAAVLGTVTVAVAVAQHCGSNEPGMVWIRPLLSEIWVLLWKKKWLWQYLAVAAISTPEDAVNFGDCDSDSAGRVAVACHCGSNEPGMAEIRPLSSEIWVILWKKKWSWQLFFFWYFLKRTIQSTAQLTILQHPNLNFSTQSPNQCSNSMYRRHHRSFFGQFSVN
jgi:hypothetical protein